MAGGPAQIDMYDFKPRMDAYFDKDLPESIRQGQRLTTMTSGQARFPIAPSIYNFRQRRPEWRAGSVNCCRTRPKIVDELAIVRSMHTEAINHDPAITYICTGDQLPGKASLGAWLSYGLGSESDNLPAFVVLTSSWTGRKEARQLYNRLWGSGFLPSAHQGVALRSAGDPVLFLSNPAGVSPGLRRRMLDAVGRINQHQYQEVGDPRIELAHRPVRNGFPHAKLRTRTR